MPAVLAAPETETYSQYFQLQKNYFPCIDLGAIKRGAEWKNTYPHPTFIKLLEKAEQILNGSSTKGLWIYGPYGTGKSQCLLALRRILERPAQEVQEYWDRFQELKEGRKDLLQKFLGLKSRQKMVIAFRYGSGEIGDTTNLCLAFEESISQALREAGCSYLGNATSRERLIEKLSDPLRAPLVERQLSQSPWCNLFSQSTVAEILDDLRQGEDTGSLVRNLVELLRQEEEICMAPSVDSLTAWMREVIARNGIQLVFLWDEFSSYMNRNAKSLDSLQKIAALAQEGNFFLTIVTHHSASEESQGNPIQDRFERVGIDMPENVAFHLIANALHLLPEKASEFNEDIKLLRQRLQKVVEAIGAESRLEDHETLFKILPLHPLAALVLKFVATTFQSNQRSLFDFLRLEEPKSYAFQWYIHTYGPYGDRPLLTVDLLWQYFTEYKKEDLTSDANRILGTYKRYARHLSPEAGRVLQALLIMLAVNRACNNQVKLLETTQEHLEWAFVGEGLANDCVAKSLEELREKHVIAKDRSISSNDYCYVVALGVGDEIELEKIKERLAKSITTSNLASKYLKEHHLLEMSGEALGKALAQRLDTPELLTVSDFGRQLKRLLERKSPLKWGLVVAKDEGESRQLEDLLDKVDWEQEGGGQTVLVDLTSTLLSPKNFGDYIEGMAYASLYSSKDRSQAEESRKKAESLLEQVWLSKLAEGPFRLYGSKLKKPGQKYPTLNTLCEELKRLLSASSSYPLFDLNERLKDSWLNLSPSRFIRAGLEAPAQPKGEMAEIEKRLGLGEVWSVPNYWQVPQLKGRPISQLKAHLEELMEKNLGSNGHIGWQEVWNYLVKEACFRPNNLYGFLLGFLLKEYQDPKYSYADRAGAGGVMDIGKLQDQLNNLVRGNDKNKVTLVRESPEMVSFKKLASYVWSFKLNESDFSSWQKRLGAALKERVWPLWMVWERLDDPQVVQGLQLFWEISKEGPASARPKAQELGRLYQERGQEWASRLREAVGKDKALQALRDFLDKFQEGRLNKLTAQLGWEPKKLQERLQSAFSTDMAYSWTKEIGQDTISGVGDELELLWRLTNLLGQGPKGGLQEAMNELSKRLSELSLPFSTLTSLESGALSPGLVDRLDRLCKGYRDYNSDLVRKQWLGALQEEGQKLGELFGNELDSFKSLYKTQLQGLDDDSVGEVFAQLRASHLNISSGSLDSAQKQVLKLAASQRRKSLQGRIQRLWQEKSGSPNPREWSQKNLIPIRYLVPQEEREISESAFRVLNDSQSSLGEEEAKRILEWLEKSSLFGLMNDLPRAKLQFRQRVAGHYHSFVPSSHSFCESLAKKMKAPVYDWTEPQMLPAIKELAEAEYKETGLPRLSRRLDELPPEVLKTLLLDVIKDDVELGIALIDKPF